MSVLSLALRWAARLSALLVVGGFLVLTVGDLSRPHSPGPSTFLEWAGILLLTTACAAMLAAWRWELAGGSLSLVAISIFAVVIRGSHTVHMVLLTMAIPGALYLLDWLTRRAHTAAHAG